jgi:hypothetical protein
VFRFLGRLAVLAVAAFVLLAALPSAPRGLPPPPESLKTPIRGAIHVHTNRSDGTASVNDVLRSAANAGLQFVIVTDHGDATRAPDLPDYRNGVLYIDAVEISTSNGHLIALGLPKAPYPLAGEGRDVVEDIHRLGGIAIAAHPGSPKPELRWTDWDAPVDGRRMAECGQRVARRADLDAGARADHVSVSAAAGTGAAAGSARIGFAAMGRTHTAASRVCGCGIGCACACWGPLAGRTI